MPNSSPLQNRCAPDGTLHAVATRGLFMGNRGGKLHGPDKQLGPTRWRGKARICCLTRFGNRRRKVMGPGYTEIFFLDEATALAAGHRPCFQCRRDDARAFAGAWGRALSMERPPLAPEMDRTLHAERLSAPETCRFRDLPEASIFTECGQFWLKAGRQALSWNFAGYGDPATPADPDRPVAAVTPPTVRAVLAAGYRPRLHRSVRLRS